MHPFEQYLRAHRIDPLALAKAAHVRYLTVWNAMQGRPIQRSHAAHLLLIARILAGVPYPGQVPLLPEQPGEHASSVLQGQRTSRP